jgi:regulator of sigma E protease
MANVLLAILGISLLMIVHELGHYVVARVCGMRVLTFSIGFGPALFKIRPKGSPTTFQLCVIPLLAYVRVDGANPMEQVDPDDAGLYQNKRWFARAAMLLGGPLANYLFASLLVFGLALYGWREEAPSSPMVVSAVMPQSAAEVAGVRPGDVIVEVEGKRVADIREMSAITSTRAGQPTRLTLERDGATTTLTVTPRDTRGRGTIGVTGKLTAHTERLGVGEAAVLAAKVPFLITEASLKGIGQLVRHRSTEGVVGPVGMTKQVAGEASKGPYALLAALVSISVALGLFNLLPFPFLDGGRILFVAFEAISGRKPNRTTEALVHAAGMLLLLGFAAAITWRDIVGS